MQIKNVLIQHFPTIMKHTMHSNRKTRYRLKLPKYKSTESKKSLPMSNIASNLTKQIADIVQNDMMTEKRNSSHPTTPRSNRKGSITGNNNYGNHSANVKLNGNMSDMEEKSQEKSKSKDKENEKQKRGSVTHKEKREKLSSSNRDRNVSLDRGVSKSIEDVEKDVRIGNVEKLADNISKDIGKFIINAFILLYDKYISEQSRYMINISSRTRTIVKRNFDRKYYQTHGNKRNYKRKSIIVRISDGIHAHSIHKHRSSHSKNLSKNGKDVTDITEENTRANSNASIRSTTVSLGKKVSDEKMKEKKEKKEKEKENEDFMTGLMDEYDRQCEKSDLTEVDLFSWLFEKLLENMELSVKEIAKVLNDSFYRFQSNTKLFNHVVNLAIQNGKKLDI